MKSDPRACKIPMTEFNHLSLGEIDELARLDSNDFVGHWELHWERWVELVRRRVFPDRGHCRMRAKLDPDFLDMLWQELRAALIVRWRVDTPEVRDEISRARNALLKAMGEVDTS